MQSQKSVPQSISSLNSPVAVGQHLCAIVSAAMDAIIMVDKQGLITFWNDVAQVIFGFSQEEVLGKTPHILLAPDRYRDAYEKGFSQFLQSGSGSAVGKTIQLVGRRKNGEEFPIEISLTSVDFNGQWLVVSIMRDITARKQAEEELRWKTAFLEAQVDASPDAILVIDSQRNCLLSNKRFEEMFKVPPCLLERKNDFELLEYFVSLTKDPKRFLEKVMYLYDHPTQTSRDEIEFKDGMILDRYSAPVLGKEGQYYGRIWKIRDITERKREEQAQREREERYRSIFDNIQDVYYECMLNGAILEISPSIERFSQYRREDLIGHSIYDIYADPKERGKLLQELEKRGSVNDFELRMRDKDGTILICSLVARLQAGPDGSKKLCGSVRDITMRKRTEETLRESQERFEKAFKSNPAPMLITEIETGRFIDFNDQWLKTMGFTREEIVGRTSKNLGVWANPGLRDRMVAELRVQKSVREIPACFITKSGETRTTLLSAEAITIDGREVMLSLIYDYTEHQQAEQEQKRLQAQLIQAQKMEAIGRLAGGVAHDFNNILTAIMLHLNLLQMDRQFGAEVQTELQELEAEAQRAVGLIRQLLIFSRRGVVQKQVLEFNSLLGNLLKMLRRVIGEHVKLELSGSSEDLWLEADSGMMEQVVMNLVVNARDAMPNGGRVTIHSQLVEYDDSVCAQNPEARPGRFVCLAVSDTGCGMDPVTMKRIFEPFFTTKEPGKGTGLGLATVYGIVKEHQGWVDIESVIGQGSKFSIFLPAHQEILKSSGKSALKEAARGGNETLLLVEDEKSVRVAASRMLQQLGYRVLEAGSAFEALQVWERNHAETDLLITDMVMPGGTSGAELAMQLLKQKTTLRAILVSGYSAEIAHWGIPESDRIKFVAKPLTVTRLAKAVREFLDAK